MQTRITPAPPRPTCAGSALALAATVLAGCGSVTGLDGSSEYGCQAPEGVKCQSVSGTYHNALANNLPAQRKPASDAAAPAASTTTAWRTASVSQVPAPPVGAGSSAAGAAIPVPLGAIDLGSLGASPLRSGPKVVRLWIKPYEDADGDLHSESYVYLQIDNGRWLVDHVQREVRERYAPVRLPTAAQAPRPAIAPAAPAAPTAPSPGPAVMPGAPAARPPGTTTPAMTPGSAGSAPTAARPAN